MAPSLITRENERTETNPADHGPRPTLRQAALIAGIGLVVMSATPFSEFSVYPKVVVDDSIEQTARNILAHRQLFVAGIFGYLIDFVADIVVAML